jgi:hypothetical protein
MNQMNLMKQIRAVGGINLFCVSFWQALAHKTNFLGCFLRKTGSLRFTRFINSDIHGGFRESNEH